MHVSLLHSSTLLDLAWQVFMFVVKTARGGRQSLPSILRLRQSSMTTIINYVWGWLGDCSLCLWCATRRLPSPDH